MHEVACRQEDIIAAFNDLKSRLEERRVALWHNYNCAIADAPRRQYDEIEQEEWHILKAGIAGIEAEAKMLQNEFERRMAYFDERDAVA